MVVVTFSTVKYFYIKTNVKVRFEVFFGGIFNLFQVKSRKCLKLHTFTTGLLKEYTTHLKIRSSPTLTTVLL